MSGEFIIDQLQELIDAVKIGKAELRGWDIALGHKGKWDNGETNIGVTFYEPDRDKVPRQEALPLEVG